MDQENKQTSRKMLKINIEPKRQINTRSRQLQDTLIETPIRAILVKLQTSRLHRVGLTPTRIHGTFLSAGRPAANQNVARDVSENNRTHRVRVGVLTKALVGHVGCVSAVYYNPVLHGLTSRA
jgi:hypothetical protein